MMLVTSGCSFSETQTKFTDTWPLHLAEFTGRQLISLGQPSQGNGLISRRLMHCLENLENTTDVLAAVMWSGPGRSDFYLDRWDHPEKSIQTVHKTTVWENKIQDESWHRWAILNPHWVDVYSKNYYDFFDNPIWATIQTLEHILRTQWYLERKQIPYVMMCYTDHVLDKAHKDHEQVSWLWKQIDFSKFITQGCYEWCRDNIPQDKFKPGDNHPSTNQHRQWARQVILPHLTGG